jgi:hypothetical protein
VKGSKIVTDSDILTLDNVPPVMAAIYLDKTPVFVRLGLQQGRLPFGAAVQNESGKWSYSISPGLLVAYKRGTLKIEMKPA